MKRPLIRKPTATLLLAGLSSTLSTLAVAGLLPTKPATYYQLNGGSDLSIPPVQTHTSITVGGDTHASLGYTCNGFNPAISIGNTLNNLGSSLEGISSSIVNSATAAVGSLPMYELEKMDPGLYNLLQNGISSAQNTFNLSMTSCQEALNKISNGQSPYQQWYNVSDSQGWLQHANAAATGQDADINVAKKEVTQKGPQYGVPWVHNQTNSGGSLGNQVPIHVLSDVAVAGYNILVDPHRPLDDSSAPAGDRTGLTTFWKTPADAGQFAAYVLGDVSITAEKNPAAKSTTAGVGLLPVLTSCPVAAPQNTCVKTLKSTLAQLVRGTGAPTPAALAKVSANALVMTPEIIDGLRNQEPTTQALYISHLAGDIAIQNLVDEALMLRRVLIAGSQAYVVQNLKPALTVVDHAIGQLNKDIENVLFENQVRKEMTSGTLKVLLQQMGNREQQAARPAATPAAPLTNGAVYQGGQSS